MTLRWMFSALLLSLVSVTPAAAQVGDVTGPGQSVPQPPAQCPQTIACTYSEQNMLPNGLRFQSLQVCGANCTTQYWVSSISSGDQLLEIDPIRGGAIVAFSRDNNPSVRVVQAVYGPNDPACCPSSFSDTTYSWDSGSNSLVAGDPQLTPADQFPGYDATRQELQNEGWLIANV
jgi:hypothetical protein